MAQTFLLAILLFPFLYAPHSRAQTADRLIVSINKISYSQRQIETYIAVKESLRKGVQNVRLVTPQNWTQAIDVFGEEMIIYQETLRLGSFKPDQTLFDKYHVIVQSKQANDQNFSKAAKRLGLTKKSIAKTLEMVLRIAAYRKSRERQEKISGDTNAQWLTDLIEGAVTRRYKDAEQYIRIQPNL